MEAQKSTFTSFKSQKILKIMKKNQELNPTFDELDTKLIINL